jgi:hypothetical protein
MQPIQQFEPSSGVKWIRASSGSTYLCPIAIVDCIDALTESDLKEICAEQSMSPEEN